MSVWHSSLEWNTQTTGRNRRRNRIRAATNKITISTSITKYHNSTFHKDKSPPPPVINNDGIDQLVPTVRLLRVTLSADLTWAVHLRGGSPESKHPLVFSPPHVQTEVEPHQVTWPVYIHITSIRSIMHVTSGQSVYDHPKVWPMLEFVQRGHVMRIFYPGRHYSDALPDDQLTTLEDSSTRDSSNKSKSQVASSTHGPCWITTEYNFSVIKQYAIPHCWTSRL